jgi:nitronate monooxygenase
MSSSGLLHTSLCDLLGIRYPVIQAGMGGATTPALVAAVSNAGGLGVLGAARMGADELRVTIGSIRTLTRHPFGVNLLLAAPEPNRQEVHAVQSVLNRFRRELSLPDGSHEVRLPPSPLADQMQVIFEEQVAVLSIGLGDPQTWIAPAHAVGTRVMAMVTTVEEAKEVAAGGADVVVAQGAEAGGHRSTFRLGPDGDVPLVGTMALVPQIVDAVPVPVVAAGGLSDGRGLVASLALGAAGIQLGTRFLVARESGVFAAYQERLLAATETDTVITNVFTGRPARSLRNRFIEQYLERKIAPLAWPLQSVAADDIYSAAKAQNDSEFYPILAGQALRLLKRGQSAAEIISEMVSEAEAVVKRLCPRT